MKWQPEIWKVILSFIICFYLHFFSVCVCVYLSVTDKSRFGPNRLCGLVLSLGHVGCQGARKCPPCLEDLSVKMLPPNQSLMGHTRHEFGCENKHEEGIYNTRHLWLGLCSRLGNCKLTKQTVMSTKTIMEDDDRSLYLLWNRYYQDHRTTVATFVLIFHIKNH